MSSNKPNFADSLASDPVCIDMLSLSSNKPQFCKCPQMNPNFASGRFLQILTLRRLLRADSNICTAYNEDPIHYGYWVSCNGETEQEAFWGAVVGGVSIGLVVSQEELELGVFIGGTNQHPLKRFSRDVLTGLTGGASWAKAMPSNTPRPPSTLSHWSVSSLLMTMQWWEKVVSGSPTTCKPD